VASDRNFLNRFNDHFKKIDGELEKGFSSRVPLVDDIGRHALLGNGKRLRPLLFVLSSRLCGYNGKDIYFLSTLFEYLHSASLLHDDVIDHAETRRNKPSARSAWGNSAAVLAGDYLSSRAMAIALSSENIDFLRIIINTGLKMSEGQSLELAHTSDWKMGKDEYMEIIISKTAELMSAACACGGIVSNAREEDIQRLKDFGLNLGIAFQLIDDLLDYSASEKDLGKPSGKDLREGKTTLPLIYAIPEMSEDDLLRLGRLSENQEADEEDYESLLECVKKSDAIEKVREESKVYVKKASEFLNNLPPSTYKDDLMMLNEFMSLRNY
jgi:octaprenyl-diphosphate synthase